MSDSTPTSSVGPNHSVFAAVARWFGTRASGVAGERDDGIDWLRVPPFIAMQLARENGDTLDWILADITYTPWTSATAKPWSRLRSASSPSAPTTTSS